MSRDREYHPERATRHQEDGGRELPRGGRSGGKGPQRMERDRDVSAALRQQLDLPRGASRERVSIGEHEYQLRDSEVRLLATVGAFRVVDLKDLSPSADPSQGEVRRLREAGLLASTDKVLDGRRTTVLHLTREGRALLHQHQRVGADEPRQAYYADVAKARELAHDAHLYRAYTTAAGRLDRAGARIERVVLDYELKREYQQFLQANNRALHRTSGRPDRTPDEIAGWAAEHGLTVVDGRVQFPDVRIEYERPDGQRDQEDLEVATEHYNARQMAAKRAAGFQMHSSRAGRIGGGASRSGGRPFDPHAADQVLR